MPNKIQQYTDLAAQTLSRLTGSQERWVSFLDSVARLYKYPFSDQLQIYAQRPDAAACADYDTWNSRVGRYVRRGSRAIALVDTTEDYPRLRYVFDISDTGGRRYPYIWQYRPEHEQAVSAALETHYNVPLTTSFSEQLEVAAAQLVDEYWNDHRRDILDIVDDSLLDGYDEFNIGAAFRNAAVVSTTYTLLSRCGLDAEGYFQPEDFVDVFSFSTPAAVTVLGTAVSRSSENILRHIEAAVKQYERERSSEHDRNYLQTGRGLPDPGHQPAGAAGHAPGQVRADAESVSEGTPPGAVEQDDSGGEPVPAPAGDRPDREQPPGADAPEAGGERGRDGGPESQRPASVGGTDEHLRSPGGGNDSGRSDLRLTESDAGQISLFPSEEEQKQNITGAESAKTPSALAFSQEDIDNILRRGSLFAGGKLRIYAMFRQDPDAKTAAAALKEEYGIGGHSHTYLDGSHGFVDHNGKGLRLQKDNPARDMTMTWNAAGKRIRQLIAEGHYLTSEEMAQHEAEHEADLPQPLSQDTYTGKERDNFDDVDPAAIREQLAEEGEASLSKPVFHDVDDELPDGLWQNETETQPYKVGDTVYLDDTAYEITNIGTSDVQLRDPTLYFPIFRAESKGRFEQQLRQDGRNGHITEFLAANLDETDSDLQDVLVGDDGLLPQRDKDIVSGWFSAGEGNTRVAQRLSETYAGAAKTMTLLGGEAADYFASTTGMEIVIHDDFHSRLTFSWQEIAPVLRTMYQQERDGFAHEPVLQQPVVLEGAPRYKEGDSVIVPLPGRDIKGTLGYVGEQEVRIDTGPYAWSHEMVSRSQFDEALRHDVRNAHLFEPETPAQKPTIKTEAVYPAGENHLPYDVVIQTLHVDEPEAERSAEPQPAAQNFHITDEHLGEGGPKAKFRANIMAIQLLMKCEEENRNATPEEQEILSRYVGWGSLSDAFDDSKPAWEMEYLELKTILTPDEYAAARASTLNSHYTSPTVIRAMYEALGNMGFTSGNILEPSMGVGNFFGMLPESMQSSRLYGVELDSITGRIAKQLYPQADITVAGFETTDRHDFYDVAVGNVPFGNYQVNDRAYNKLGFSIHNYFFAKALDQVRPGGVVAFVTSRYTMDAKDSTARKYLAQRAELLGAIRLPSNAFKANAGTEVTTDIIFLQKRDRPVAVEPEWVHLEETEDGIPVNAYFVRHPEMVLGTLVLDDKMYGNKNEIVCQPFTDTTLADQLHEAVQNITGEYREAELPELGEDEEISTAIPADPDVKNYSFTVVDGDVYYRENSIMVRPELNATARERVKGMIGLRDCVRRLIDLQMTEYTPDTEIAAAQTELNRRYDAFTARYGLINDRANRLAFSDDSSYYLLCSLEILDKDQKLERKADIFTKRTIRQHTAVTSVDTAAEALAVSIGEKACVDLPYMAQLSGLPEEQVIRDLTGVIYKDPVKQVWQTADEYLSGNVRRKLREAKRAAEKDAGYQINVTALEKAQPKDLDASEIEVRIGSTWIDKSYFQQFMYETFDTPFYLRRQIEVSYSAYTAEWNISHKGAISEYNVEAYSTYGTPRANAYRLLEDALNLRDTRIYDTFEDEDGRERRVLNAKETTLVQQKQQLIKDAFRDWIWKDPDRREALVRQYNEEMNSTRPREYDGSHIVFSGMNPEITLREHQKNAIAHVLYGGNTLLAHEVGAGKTFEMVAAAMESKRLGLCSKSLFVVPNHLTDQWASEFLRLYPSANILVTTKKDFEPHNRKKFCSRIATGDYDAVIIGHSQFERIPISKERQIRLLEEQIADITDGIAELKEVNGERFSIKQLEKTKKNLTAKLEKLQADDRKDDVITFEELGVDRLFVDESDNYKNLFLYTKMRNVAGLSATDAQKSSDMFMKCRYMDEVTGSRGIVFATGTPISNSMTEMYTIQRYLQYGRLQEMGMGHFDCWASRFGETVTALELAPEGTGYRARTRFAKFFNLPELMSIFKGVADIKTADQLNLPTPKVEYHVYTAEPTEAQKEMVKALSERASAVHRGIVDAHQDNMLKITSDGRKLGLDQRIINPMLPDEPGTKVNLCVENILRYWREGEADKLTQLVFCDISTPKGRKTAKTSGTALDSPEIHALETLIPAEEPEQPFTIYEDIRQKLIANGMPPEQIAFIHDADTEQKKAALFAKVRAGEVRVLLGSTEKMGAGTNVQDRLIAMHDLDCPWRPRDLIQRKGRIERQGNRNETVHVCRYVTKGTFDAYLWQTVENKQKFISQIMTSKAPVRSCEDVDETALSFAEIKALCAGDPRIKERMDLDVSASKLRIMKASHQSQQYRLEDNLLRFFPQKIEENKGFIRGFEADMQTLSAHPLPDEGFIGMEIRGDILTDKENAGAALLDAVKEIRTGAETEIGHYRGFVMSAYYEPFQQKYLLYLKGGMTHTVELGPDPRGNLIRIENVLAQMPNRLKSVQTQLENLYQQQAAAQEQMGVPFPYEQELTEKTARLIELDAQLNLETETEPMRTDDTEQETEAAKSERPSVLAMLKMKPPAHTPTGRPHEHGKEYNER